MTRNRNSQRGEGKVGCIVSLLVLVIVGAAAIKIVPVLYTNNELVKAAEEIAGRAAVITQETIDLQIRSKAKDLNIPEALAPGAIVVLRSGATSGSCKVTLKYKRKVDLFGITSIDFNTDTTKTVLFMDVR